MIMELNNHRKYIQRKKTTLISPPLEYFRRDFKKTSVDILNQASQSYKSPSATREGPSPVNPPFDLSFNNIYR
jgi:hypothetical protein